MVSIRLLRRACYHREPRLFERLLENKGGYRYGNVLKIETVYVAVPLVPFPGGNG